MKIFMRSTVCAAADDPNLDCAKAFNKQDNVQNITPEFTPVALTHFSAF